MVVQVDPIKPKLKAPGIGRLKVKYNILLYSFTFKSDVCRYTAAAKDPAAPRLRAMRTNSKLTDISAQQTDEIAALRRLGGAG
jgi:hypothetical protein